MNAEDFYYTDDYDGNLHFELEMTDLHYIADSAYVPPTERDAARERIAELEAWRHEDYENLMLERRLAQHDAEEGDVS